MKKLRKRAAALSRRIARTQKWRQRAAKLVEWLRDHKQHRLSKAATRVTTGLGKRLKALHADLRKVQERIDKLGEQGKAGRDAYLKFLEDSVGKTEGSDWQRQIAAEMGVPWEWPWCSTLTAYGLWKHGGFSREELPQQTPYSGAWLTWAHGSRISYAQAQPGDLLIFDWGDGGMTDHVATYIGGGLKIGGNENDRVERDAVPTGNIVGVVRPDWSR